MARKNQIETPGVTAPVVDEPAPQPAKEEPQLEAQRLTPTELAVKTEQVIQAAKQESKKVREEKFPIGSTMGAFTLTANGWEILGG